MIAAPMNAVTYDRPSRCRQPTWLTGDLADDQPSEPLLR
jgi:hypothetical protein